MGSRGQNWQKDKTSINPWISREILNIIDERRKSKNAVNEAGKMEYRQLKNEIGTNG